MRDVHDCGQPPGKALADEPGRTIFQADERWLHESSFSSSFCLTVLVYQAFI